MNTKTDRKAIKHATITLVNVDPTWTSVLRVQPLSAEKLCTGSLSRVHESISSSQLKDKFRSSITLLSSSRSFTCPPVFLRIYIYQSFDYFFPRFSSHSCRLTAFLSLFGQGSRVILFLRLFSSPSMQNVRRSDATILKT